MFRSVGTRVFDWGSLAARLPAASRGEFALLRAAYTAAQTKYVSLIKLKTHQADVYSLDKFPAAVAPIDWDHFNKAIKSPGFVDDIKKSVRLFPSLRFHQAVLIMGIV